MIEPVTPRPASDALSRPSEDAQSLSLKVATQRLRRPLILAGLFSGLLSLLTFSGALFMIQVYDRVLPAHSLPTLQALMVMMGLVYGLMALLDAVRSRLFLHMGQYLYNRLADAVFRAHIGAALDGRPQVGAQLLRDLEQLRSFLSGSGPVVGLDLPWAPLFLILLFVLHPLLGVVCATGMVLLVSLTLLANRATAAHQREITRFAAEAQSLSDACRHSAGTLVPLGMVPQLQRHWRTLGGFAGDHLFQQGATAGLYAALSRACRLGLQSVVLAAGAYLVITGKASGGVMMAASILLGRALSPIEQAIGLWKPAVATREACQRLQEALSEVSDTPGVRLPLPSRHLRVEKVQAVTPEGRPFLDLSGFSLEAGEMLAVVGPSGAGKSSLMKALVGALPGSSGEVRFDDSTLSQWSPADRARIIGYLPQEVDLLPGSLAENIARFDPDATSDAILKAAEAAGLGPWIRSLPQGFDTRLGPGETVLSGGQKQRIALARALYGDPFVLILDEPNAALDAHGEGALLTALKRHCARGGIAIVSVHRQALIQCAHKILVLTAGKVARLGAPADIFRPHGLVAVNQG